MKLKRVICVLLILVMVFSMTACSVTIPVVATSNSVGSKCGESSGYFLGIIPVSGDAGINTAAKIAGITKISHVDLKLEPILAVLKITTQVYGE